MKNQSDVIFRDIVFRHIIIIVVIMGCTTSSPSAEDVAGDGQKVNGAKHASTVGGGSRGDRREANGEARRNSRNKGEFTAHINI